jgi:hypothetical protein
MSGTIILLLAAVFALAAIAKLRSRDAFAAVLRSLVPALLVKPLSVMVPVLELALAAFLLSGIATQTAIGVSIGVLVLFTAVLGEMWRRGLKGCACFGESVNTATTSSGVIRNVMLIVAASCVVSNPGAVSFLGLDISSFLGRMTVVVGALCFWPCLVALIGQRKYLFN